MSYDERLERERDDSTIRNCNEDDRKRASWKRTTLDIQDDGRKVQAMTQ